MGRYSFIGSSQNLSEAQVTQLHRNPNQGRGLSSTNMVNNIQAMRNFGYYKRTTMGNLSAGRRLRPGNLGGAWF